MIDLRSDTVTQPTEAMRRAMLTAEVGDDVYGDDPTVLRLEALAAETMGKEAAMFVPSGTMGNQLAIMTHTRRGDEIIAGANSHIVIHEVGAPAILSGVMVRTVDCESHIMDRALVAEAIRGEDIHVPPTGLICVEEPLALGKLAPLESLAGIYALAQEKGLPVHMDGARLFNAATALRVSPKEIACYADSVMFCLSKGLCAPIGSMLCGSKDFIARARKNRKILGGGLRQAGILAACGIIAIEEMSRRLGEDHANARYLAQGLMALDGVVLDMDTVEINMVFFRLDKPAALRSGLPELLLAQGIKINGEEDGQFRFVTNNDVTRADIDRVLLVLGDILAQ